jgi:hypothetical protein
LEDEVEMEQEEAEKALNVAGEWRECQMKEVKLSHVSRERMIFETNRSFK